MTATQQEQPTMPARPAPQKPRGPSGPADFYTEQRTRGHSHEQAIAVTAKTFGYSRGQEGDVERWLEAARRDFEQPEPPAAEPESELESEVDPLNPIAADAGRRLGELRAQRARLSLDAVSNPEGPEAQELASIEDEIASAERALERVERARAERDRRAVEAAEEAERKAREQAQSEADADTPKLIAEAKAIDKELLGAARRIAARQRRGRHQQECLERAGSHVGPVDVWAVSEYELAIRHALDRGGCGQVVEPAPGHGRAEFAPLYRGD